MPEEMISGCFFVLFFYDYAALFIAAGNSVFQNSLHAILTEYSGIVLFIDLGQSVLAGRVQLTFLCIFQFNNDSDLFRIDFDQNIAVSLTAFPVGEYQPVFFIT